MSHHFHNENYNWGITNMIGDYFFGKKLRDAHMSHHFHNENYNWGITNMIGDYFFGTLKDNKSIKKSTTAKSIAGYTD